MEGLLAFEVTAAQPELEASFDLLLYSEFTDVDALQAYATHPEHVAVAQLIGAVRSGRAAYSTTTRRGSFPDMCDGSWAVAAGLAAARTGALVAVTRRVAGLPY